MSGLFNFMGEVEPSSADGMRMERDEKGLIFMEAVRETCCTHCVHREVCKFKRLFLQAINAVQDAEISSTEENGVRLVRVRDLPYIAEMDLKCKHYKKEKIDVYRR